MFTPDELDALLLGVELVQRLPDATLANNAKDVLSKISSVLPSKLQCVLKPSAVLFKPEEPVTNKIDTRQIRAAIRDGKKLLIDYRSADGTISKRVIWPIVLGYDQSHCLLISWCEKRESFRHFRTDRLVRTLLLNEHINSDREALRLRWEEWREEELSRFKELNLSGRFE